MPQKFLWHRSNWLALYLQEAYVGGGGTKMHKYPSINHYETSGRNRAHNQLIKPFEGISIYSLLSHSLFRSIVAKYKKVSSFTYCNCIFWIQDLWPLVLSHMLPGEEWQVFPAASQAIPGIMASCRNSVSCWIFVSVPLEKRSSRRGLSFSIIFTWWFTKCQH